MLLALGASGLGFGLALLLQAGERPAELRLWLVVCAGVAVVALFWLRAVEARRLAADRRGNPQLFVSDLLTVSLAMGCHFAAVRTWAAHHFLKLGLVGGAALLAAMILSLLNASRRGFLRGPERAAYAVGSVAALLGLGGAALITSMSMLALCIGELGGYCEWLLESEGPRDGGRGVLYAGLLGFAGLAAGLSLCGWARRRRGQREQSGTR